VDDFGPKRVAVAWEAGLRDTYEHREARVLLEVLPTTSCGEASAVCPGDLCELLEEDGAIAYCPVCRRAWSGPEVNPCPWPAEEALGEGPKLCSSHIAASERARRGD
jgi:hypothetical protein